MNRYQTSSPRVAFGIAAVAMTALTIGVSVVLPARMGSDSPEPRVLAASKVAAPASKGVVTGSATGHVVASRETGLSAVPCASNPNRKPEG